MTILGSAKTFLATNTSVRVANLVKIELATPTPTYAYLTDYLADVAYGGNIYQAGRIKSVGSVRMVQGVQNYTLQVNIAGEILEELQRGLSSYSYEGRRIEVLKAYLSDTGTVVPFDPEDNGPFKLFFGSITAITINEDVTKGSSVVTWECAGLLQDFEKVNGRITDDAAHRGLVSAGGGLDPVPSAGAKKESHKTDTGFLHANQTISLGLSYIGKDTEYYLKKSWGGLKTKLRTREIEVTRKIDFNTSLEAKYLPVVYGVRRVPGIPVFIDSLQSNPSTVYVVYAFCEGEIQSFLDLYIDGVSVICSGATTKEVSGVCYGNKQQGDTLSVYVEPSKYVEREYRFQLAKFSITSEIKSDSGNNVVGATNTEGTRHEQSFNIIGEKGSIWAKFYHGKSDQTPCPELVNLAANRMFLLQNQLRKRDGSSWGPEYWEAAGVGKSGAALLDTAYIVVKFNLSDDRTSIPNIEAVISGKLPKVVTSATTYANQYSLNPVDHLFDYLTDSVAGAALDPDTEIDKASFKEVADWLNTTDTSYETSYLKYWRYVGWPSSDYALARARMQCNTLLTTEDPVTKNVEEILKQFNGTLNVIGGKYTLSIEKDAAPVADILMTEVIGRVSIKDTPNKDKWNSIQASIIDPGLEWSTAQISFFNSQFLTEDKGIQKRGNTAFTHITNYYTARAKAEKALKDSRFNRTLSFTTYYKYSYLKPNDIVTFTYSRFGYDLAKFRVVSVEIMENGLVGLTISQYDTNTDATTTQPPINTADDNTPVASLAPLNVVFSTLPNADILISEVNDDTYGMLYWDAPITGSGIMRYEVAVYPQGSPNEAIYIQSVPANTVSVTVTRENYSLIPVLWANSKSISVEQKNYALIPLIDPNVTYVMKVQTVLTSGEKSPFSLITYIAPNYVEPAVIPVVEDFRVTNLALDGSFIGPNIDFAWTALPTTSWLSSYELEIRDSVSGNIILSASGISPTASGYMFTLSQNKAGYAANNGGAVGAYRSITARIRAVTVGGKFSDWSNL